MSWNLFKLCWLPWMFFSGLLPAPASGASATTGVSLTDMSTPAHLEADNSKDQEIEACLRFMDRTLGAAETQALLRSNPSLKKRLNLAQVFTHFHLLRLRTSESHARGLLSQASGRIGTPTLLDELVLSIIDAGLLHQFGSRTYHFRKLFTIYVKEEELRKLDAFPWAKALLEKGKTVFVRGTGAQAVMASSARDGFSSWISLAPVCRMYIQPIRKLFAERNVEPTTSELVKALAEGIPGFETFWNANVQHPERVKGEPLNHLGSLAANAEVQLDLVETVEGEFTHDEKRVALDLLLGAAHHLKLAVLDRLTATRAKLQDSAELLRVLNLVVYRAKRCESRLVSATE